MPLTSIASVQNVYSVASPQEFIDLVTTCNYIVAGQSEDGRISIVKTTAGSITDIRPPVKGLIFRTDTGEIIAPAIGEPGEPRFPLTPSSLIPSLTIPSSSIPSSITSSLIPSSIPSSQQEGVRGNLGSPGWSMAMDGVLIRIYRYKDNVHWSTSGMFDPTEGRWSGNRTFGSLFNDVLNLKQVNYDAIKENLCYYAILEHSELLSFYRPMDTYAMLTLVRVVDMYGNIEPMEKLREHNDAFTNILEYKQFKTANPFEDEEFVAHLNIINQELPPGPVTYDTFGVMIYYLNDMVRILSSQAKKAIPLVPNMPNVWQHWIHCITMGGFECVDLYTKFFPWRKVEFDVYSGKLRAYYGSDIQPGRTFTKKILRDFIRSVPGVAKPETQPTEQIQETQPTEQIQETQPTEQIQETQPMEQIQETQPTEQIQETQPTEQIQETQPTEQIQETQPTEQIQETQPMEQIQETQPMEQIQETQPTEQIQETRVQPIDLKSCNIS